jgi:hypothetical protein
MTVARNSADVLNVWKDRGWLKNEHDFTAAQSYIDQAKDCILSACNIPVRAMVPDGLFYAWAELSHNMYANTESGGAIGAVKSVADGDTTVTYASDTASSGLEAILPGIQSLIARYRRMP